MGIVNMITRNCTQIAVYWEFIGMTGYGVGKSFKAPVEIMCRWDDKHQIIPTGQIGENLLSRAIVTVLQEVTEQGYLFLGSFDDLDSACIIDPDDSSGSEESSGSPIQYSADPTLEPDSFLIKQVAKLPALGSTTEFLYKAYLSEWQTM